MFKWISEQKRWSADDVLKVRGTTRQLDPRKEGEEVDLHIAADRSAVQKAPPPPTLDAPPDVRSFYMRRSDVVQYG